MEKITNIPDLAYDKRSGKISQKENSLDVLLPRGSSLIHKKTGNKYFYCRVLINATNDNDGQLMVLYKNENNMRFVRELNEFCEKFMADLSEFML